MRTNPETTSALTRPLPGPEGLAISETIAAIERYRDTSRRSAEAYARYEAVGTVDEVPYELGRRWEKWTDAAAIAKGHAESELVHCIQGHREEVNHVHATYFGRREPDICMPYTARAVAYKDTLYISAPDPTSDEGEVILVVLPKSAIVDLQAELTEGGRS